MERLLMTIGLGLARCAALADLQLIQVSIEGSRLIQVSFEGSDTGGRIRQPMQGCQTSVKGDPCYERVLWAMQEGIAQSPEWYAPLTSNSSFEDFQRHLHGTARLAHVCPEPCSEQHPNGRSRVQQLMTVPFPAQDCHTANESDPCYYWVRWAMRKGIVQLSSRYAPLTSNSSFEDIQRFLHGQPRLAHVCPEPCSEQYPSAMVPAQQSASAPAPAQDCHTVAESDPCYEKVMWAMQTGIVHNPEWYSPLTISSSFEDFQRLLHGLPRLAHVCPVPCSEMHPSAMLPPQQSASAPAPAQACHTVVESDPCYEKVLWAMQTGIVHNPEWYSPLTSSSSFQDFQRLLHGRARLAHVCPEPCSEQHPSARLPTQQLVTAPSPAKACHTAVESDPCYEKVLWAMREGIAQSPEWYAPLTSSSSFEDFQRHLHRTARLAHVCPEPCSEQHQRQQPATAPSPASSCHTSVEGDLCYEKVLWAMREGIAQSPEWYSPLTISSSFEDFQRHLHGTSRLAHVCPEPCSEQHPRQQPATATSPASSCHTSVEGDLCYEKVLWAMREGIAQSPEWYAPLTSSSSFEDFQRHLHGTARLAHVCPEPCSEQRPNARLPAQQAAPAPSPALSCHTSVEGDLCYEKVLWAMREGIAQSPVWYAPLTSNSSFEDFQRHLHGTSRLAHVCPEPCPMRRRDDRQIPLNNPVHVGTPMPTEVHLDELLNMSYEGFERSGSNCNCGGYLREFPDEHTTLEICAAECLHTPGCRSFGLHPWQSIWNGHCNLYDAECEDTDGHAEDTTCGNPIPEGAIQINFNNLATVVPTPAPTIDVCDVTDGSWPSSVYPCICGLEECHTSEICSVDSCAVPRGLKVEWPCDAPGYGIGSKYFGLLGTSATGSPVYSSVDDKYLYWDVSCDGYERPAADQRPRWVLDNDEPNMSAGMDLDGDGNCSFFGYLSSAEDRGVPLGDTPWKVACESGIISTTVNIEYVPVMPTPAPTLEPGAPCPCQDTCGSFSYIDLDGDGCMREAEVDAVPELSGHFLEMDLDGDGCVNRTECAMSPHSAELPNFPIRGPAECDYGYYFLPGTSVCGECLSGESRRRRSEACTECPSGKFDAGEFDSCIGGAYLTEPLEIGAEEVPISKDTDESGVVLTVGDGITMSSRNPGYFERFVITEKVGFGDDERRTERQERLFRKRGPFFGLDHPTNGVFKKYDAMLSACTGINGIDLSQKYPCACGSIFCTAGQTCDQSCGGTVTELPGGGVYGEAGCCIDPPPGFVMPTPAPTVQARGDPHLVNLQGEHFDINHGGEFDLLRIPQAASKPVEVAMRATIGPEYRKPCTTYITEVELYGSWLGNRSVQMRSYMRSHSRDDVDRFLSLRVLNHGTSPEEVPWTNITDWTDEGYVLSGHPKRKQFKVTLSKTQWHSNKGKYGALNAAGQFVVNIQKVSKKFNESAMVVVRQDLPEQEHLNVAVRKLGALGRADIGGLLGFDSHPESLEEVTPECQRHRDGLDDKKGPQTKPSWKTRWERIKAQRALGGSMNDNEAAGTLIEGERGGRSLMCVCPTQESMGIAGEEYIYRLARSDIEGVVADFQVGRLAEATWD